MTARLRQRGFTLMELLIAIGIFVVMAAMAYGGLSAVIETRESVSAALDRSKTLQLAVWRIRNDIEQIVDRPIRDAFGDTQPAIAGSPEIGLAFTHNGWRNPLGDLRSHLQRVAYRLDEDNNLVRDHWRVLDQAQDSVPVESTLLADVETLEWRYLDNNREWQERWPVSGGLGPGGLGPGPALAPPAPGSGLPGELAGNRANPPLAVELRLTTANWGELRLLFMVPGAEPAAAS